MRTNSGVNTNTSTRTAVVKRKNFCFTVGFFRVVHVTRINSAVKGACRGVWSPLDASFKPKAFAFHFGNAPTLADVQSSVVRVSCMHSCCLMHTAVEESVVGAVCRITSK